MRYLVMILIAFTGLLIAQETADRRFSGAVMFNGSFNLSGGVTAGGGIFSGTGNSYLVFGIGKGGAIEAYKDVKFVCYTGLGFRSDDILIDIGYVKGVAQITEEKYNLLTNSKISTLEYPDGVRVGISYVNGVMVFGLGFGTLSDVYGSVGIVF